MRFPKINGQFTNISSSLQTLIYQQGGFQSLIIGYMGKQRNTQNALEDYLMEDGLESLQRKTLFTEY